MNTSSFSPFPDSRGDPEAAPPDGGAFTSGELGPAQRTGNNAPVGRPELLAKDLRNEVELRDYDESPVQRADNHKDERKGAESGV